MQPMSYRLLRHALTISLAGYAAYSDLRSREVSDAVWVALLLLSTPLVLFEAFSADRLTLLLYILSFQLAFVFGLTSTAFNIMGDADFIAIACLGLVGFPPPSVYPGPLSIPFLPVILASAVLSLTYPAANLARNIPRRRQLLEGVAASRHEKILALLLLRKVGAEEYKARRNFYSLAERRVGGQTRLIFSPRIRWEEPANLEGEVWVSPHVPFVLFLTLGYIVYVALELVAAP